MCLPFWQGARHAEGGLGTSGFDLHSQRSANASCVGDWFILLKVYKFNHWVAMVD